MPIPIPNALLVEGGDLFARYGDAFDDVFARVCCRGLQALAAQQETYAAFTRASADFMRHLHTELCEFTAQYSLSVQPGPSLALVQEAAFCMIEDMALIMREKKLRMGCTGLCAGEEELMAFFEGSGYWKAGDGTLVTDVYYAQLPARVLHELLERTENAVRSAV